jgi:hypothetical protein
MEGQQYSDPSIPYFLQDAPEDEQGGLDALSSVFPEPQGEIALFELDEFGSNPTVLPTREDGHVQVTGQGPLILIARAQLRIPFGGCTYWSKLYHTIRRAPGPVGSEDNAYPWPALYRKMSLPGPEDPPNPTVEIMYEGADETRAEHVIRAAVNTSHAYMPIAMYDGLHALEFSIQTRSETIYTFPSFIFYYVSGPSRAALGDPMLVYVSIFHVCPLAT